MLAQCSAQLGLSQACEMRESIILSDRAALRPQSQVLGQIGARLTGADRRQQALTGANNRSQAPGGSGPVRSTA